MNPAKRILIYRLGSLGDTVVALPCFHLIRSAFPSAHISILTNRPVQAKAAPLTSVLGGSGLFDQALDYPIELRRFGEISKLRHRLRAGKFDLVIHLSAARGLWNSVRDYFFFRWCGIPKIIGVPFRREDLQVAQTESGLYEAEAVRLARRLRPLGQVNLCDSNSWDLRLTPEEKSEADRLLGETEIVSPFIAISPGTKLSVKDWTPENWKQLLTQLSNFYPRLSILALGAEDEQETVDSSLVLWKGTAANLCGKTSPRVSAAILEKAALFVGHDSGPMHLAAAVGTPCVALFAAHAARGQWFPRGERNRILVAENLCSACSASPCRQINGKCILSITVAEVLETVKQQLALLSATS